MLEHGNSDNTTMVILYLDYLITCSYKANEHWNLHVVKKIEDY